MECKTHPDAPHGFLRNASHTEGRYVCECEYWKEDMKTIMEIAKEAGDDWDHTLKEDREFLKLFATLVRADEREECAKDWEALHGYDKHGVAAAIRARGNT